jgi:tRNA G18 (ribose-2'-O)-methylase SpoU
MTEPDMRKLSFEEISAMRKSVSEIAKSSPFPVTVLLDNIRSLHNIGSIFRTSDGALIEKLYLCGITGTPPRNEIRKTSLGAEESVSWVYFENAVDAITELKGKNYQIIALEQTTQSIDYRRAIYQYPLCLIVGHEYNGIQEDLVKMSDMAVEIPMYGIKHSLNVSVAFGIVIYEIIQQYKNGIK